MLTPLIQEATIFFETYSREFDNRDWAKFTLLLHEPFTTVSGDGSVHFSKSRSEASITPNSTYGRRDHESNE
jgi:hypothetical protein